MRMCGFAAAMTIYLLFLALEARVLANLAAVSNASIATCSDEVAASSTSQSCESFHSAPLIQAQENPHLLVHGIL